MLALGLSLLLFTTLGCFGAAEVNDLAGTSLPRWACPTRTALPPIEVEDGTTLNPQGTPVPSQRMTEPYEREPYNGVGKRPILLPTPYTKTGTSFFLGQIINLGSTLDVRVEVVAQGTPITADLPEPRQLYLLQTHWENRGQPLPFDPGRQMVLTMVKQTSGRQMAGQWRWDTRAAEAAGLPASEAVLHTDIPSGSSKIVIPVLAPVGTPQTIDLQLDPPDAAANGAGSLRVQFTRAEELNCEQPGTVAASYEDVQQPIIPPPVAPGTDRIVAFAMQQLGRQYCWGGKGWQPCSGLGVTPACAAYPCWDCSGLTWGAYNANGIVIGHGTQNQKNYPAVPQDQVQPGDLLLFGGINQQGRGATITHVGLYAGDIDGDGTGDMIHAANYPTGVVLAKNVLGNRYYLQRLAIITRPPRGSG